MLSADTSKSMLMNIPIAVLLVSGLRILFNEVEFRWKVHNARPLSYLSHLEKKQLSPNDSRLSTTPPPSKWKRKIDSPAVEDAMQDFINKLLQDFVIDLWYSDISPDKEAPELIRAIIMDVLGEVSGRVKEVNLVDLPTRDVVDLIGNTWIFSEETRLQLVWMLWEHCLLKNGMKGSSAAHGWTFSCCSKTKGGTMPPGSVHCQRIFNLLSNGTYYEFCKPKDKGFKDAGSEQSPVHDHAIYAAHGQNRESPLRKKITAHTQGIDKCLFRNDDKKELSTHASRSSVSNTVQDESDHYRSSDWARVFEAATQRRTEVLMPKNLENMWTIGRNYKKKLQKNTAKGPQVAQEKMSESSTMLRKDLVTEVPIQKPETSRRMEDKTPIQLPPKPQPDTGLTDMDLNKRVYSKRGSIADELEHAASVFPR